MKKKRLTNFLLAIATIFALVVFSFYFVNGTGELTYWKLKCNNFLAENREAEKGQIVLLGDSQLDLYQEDKFLSEYTIYNRGIGGDTTEGVLKRTNTFLPLQPKLVIMEIGINDLAQGISLNKITENYISIINKIKEVSPSCKFILISVYPISYRFYINNDYMLEWVQQLNSNILEIASNRDYATYLDAYSELKGENGYLKPEFTIDRIHLNETGNFALTSKLQPLIEDMLNE